MTTTPSTPSELIALNDKPLLDQVNDLLEDMKLNDTLDLVQEILSNLQEYHADLAVVHEDTNVGNIYVAEAAALLDAVMKVRSISRAAEEGATA